MNADQDLCGCAEGRLALTPALSPRRGSDIL